MKTKSKVSVAKTEDSNPKLTRLLTEREIVRKNIQEAALNLPTLREVEDGYIKTVLRNTSTKTQCARILGVSPITLNKRLAQIGRS